MKYLHFCAVIFSLLRNSTGVPTLTSLKSIQILNFNKFLESLSPSFIFVNAINPSFTFNPLTLVARYKYNLESLSHEPFKIIYTSFEITPNIYSYYAGSGSLFLF